MLALLGKLACQGLLDSESPTQVLTKYGSLFINQSGAVEGNVEWAENVSTSRQGKQNSMLTQFIQCDAEDNARV